MFTVRHYLIPLAILCLFVAHIAYAWTPPFEDEQGDLFTTHLLAATIDCHAGEETLTIPATFPPHDGIGWVFAIPAPPDQVRIAFCPGATYYRGTWLTQLACYRIANMNAAARLFEVYPIICCAFQPSLSRTAMLPLPSPRVVKADGYCAQIVAPANAPALEQAIADAGIVVDPTDVVSLSPLADSQHAFVLLTAPRPKLSAWLADDFSIRSPAEISDSLEISFPSGLPVLPAALRWHDEGDSEFNLTILGDQQPASPPPHSYLHRFVGHGLQTIGGHRSVINPGVHYTRMEGFLDGANLPAITFLSYTDSRLTASNAILSLHWLLLTAIFILAVAALSYIAGGLAGLLIFRRWHQYARIGLWNLLTVVAVWIRVSTGGRCRGSSRRADWFALCFSLIFISLCSLLNMLAMHALGFDPR